MTTRSATSGQEKPKGYWQAIANYDYAIEQFNADIGFDEAGMQQAHEIYKQGIDHPTHGWFFVKLAEITECIEQTYNVSSETLSADIDAYGELCETYLDIASWCGEWND